MYGINLPAFTIIYHEFTPFNVGKYTIHIEHNMDLKSTTQKFSEIFSQEVLHPSCMESKTCIARVVTLSATSVQHLHGGPYRAQGKKRIESED